MNAIFFLETSQTIGVVETEYFQVDTQKNAHVNAINTF